MKRIARKFRKSINLSFALLFLLLLVGCKNDPQEKLYGKWCLKDGRDETGKTRSIWTNEGKWEATKDSFIN